MKSLALLSNQLRLSYEVMGQPLVKSSGAAPISPLILIQGWACTKEDWDPLPSLLLPSGSHLKSFHSLLKYDHIGIGESSLPMANQKITMETLVKDLRELIGQVYGENRKCSLLGISLGGAVAQQYAISYPDQVTSLILGATTHGGNTAIPPPNPGVFKTFDAWKDKGEGGDPDHLRQIARNWLAINLPQSWIQQHPEEFAQRVEHFLMPTRRNEGIKAQLNAVGRINTASKLKQLFEKPQGSGGAFRIPTLILHGGEDQVLPVGNGKSLANLIPGAQFQLLKGAGHMFWVSHAAETAALIEQFLLRVQ